MRNDNLFFSLSLVFLVFFAVPPLAISHGDPNQDEVIPFDSDRWDVSNAKVVDFLGRKALMGLAILKDVEFENGVIEVEIAVTTDRARSYPGINFRIQPNRSWERFYIRPHRSALYDDVLQYVPAFNGVDSWQLYHGFGCTARATIPVNVWFHVKVEVTGSQARIFLQNAVTPALVIDDLKHGQSKGGLGLMGPLNGTTYFSNFSYRADNGLRFEAPPHREASPGVIREWQISKPFPALKVDLEQPPAAQNLGDPGWKPITGDSSGLVDIGRYYPRSAEPDVVFAKTILRAGGDENRKIDFGYSDAVSIFLNGKLLFMGDSSYQGRDLSFLGIVGFFDSVILPLKKGENELMLAIAESFGGWGFMVRDGHSVYAAEGVKKIWETPKDMLVPESAVYDPARQAVYVSNFNNFVPSFAEGLQSITKVSLDGKIENLQWVTGLKNPTGMAVAGDRLYVVERTGLAEIDIRAAKIVNRYPVAGAGVGTALLNDVAAAADGTLYISDSRRSTIYRYSAGQVEEWLKGPQVIQPNGVHVLGGKLIVGTNGDNCLKTIDLATKEVTTIINLGPGIIDGIESDAAGNILVSHNEGRLYRVTLDGRVTKLLDLTVVATNIADFDYIPDKNMIVFPTFTNNRVMCWQLEGKANMSKAKN